MSSPETALSPAARACRNRTDSVAGVLLTGGASRRMGRDKAMLPVGGVPNAVRLADLLNLVCLLAFEVGPGRSGLPTTLEEPAGSGPLAAVHAGADALHRVGYRGPALVLACDLPYVGLPVLVWLASWPGTASMVPVVHGRPQPLCARWSDRDLEVAGTLAQEGERSMKALLEEVKDGVFFAGEASWPDGVTARDFIDVDSAATSAELGLLPE